MQCPTCGKENPAGARFCSKCGSRMILVCPQCGAELPADPEARFCVACGVPFATSTFPPGEPGSFDLNQAIQRLVPKEFAERLREARGRAGPGERRMVTILFSDIKGSTAIAENLDPEDVVEIMKGAFRFLIEPIFRYEGTVARLMGDAILAFFGAPIAHEDDPERAIRAALDILAGAREYAASLERERGIRGLNVRIGINTGVAVVGEVGSDLRVEYTAMGDVVNLAAGLENAAAPGTILISADTHKLVAHAFDVEALGRIQVKGKAEPVAVYRVLASRAAAGKLRGIAGLASPLVGRQQEFLALREALERLQAGVGGIVTIVGEAGIGKSRLIAEVRSRSAGQGSGQPTPLRWAEGRCLSYGSSIAYLLWVEVLRSLLRISADNAPEAARDALRQVVQSLDLQQSEETAACLARLMSLTPEVAGGPATESLAGEQLRRGTFRALEAIVEAVAIQQPTVIVCEDLHWADPTSLDLLEQLLALTDRAPLLFICALRPQVEHGSWRIRENAARFYPHRHTDLWLHPLTATDSEALVANLLGLVISGPGTGDTGRCEGVPHKLVWRILSHSEGNPLYVEEVIRSLIDSGAIIQDEADGRWRATGDVTEIAIPDTLQGVLTSRIDRLPRDTRRVLQLAAVIGRIFPYRVLAAIAGEEPALDGHLLILQRAEMIRERARLPELEYIFKHHLTHEAAYDGLLKKERSLYHWQVATTLERLYADRIEERVEWLAYHWERAGDLVKAGSYLLQAGDRARRLGASPEAVEFYRAALEKAEQLPAPAGAIRPAHLRELLGDVYLENLARNDEALEHYTAFLVLTESAEDAARAERKVAGVHLLRGELADAQRHYEAALDRLSGLPPVAEASRVHFGLSYLFMSKNRWDDAACHAEASLAISDPIGDTRGVADAYKLLGTITSHQGDLEGSAAYLERSLRLYRELGDLPRTAQACNNLGEANRLLGRMEQALACLNEGLALAVRIGDTREEVLLLTTLAQTLLDQGLREMAVSHLERALPLALQSGVVARIIPLHAILGLAYEQVGRLDEARHHLGEAEALSRRTQHYRFMADIHLGFACLDTTLGNLEEAQQHLDLALEAAGPGQSDAFCGQVLRCQGCLDGRQGMWDRAVTHLEESLACLSRAKLMVEEARTRLSLGLAFASRGAEGDAGRACQQLRAARSRFEQLQAAGYLGELKAHLRELGCDL